MIKRFTIQQTISVDQFETRPMCGVHGREVKRRTIQSEFDSLRWTSTSELFIGSYIRREYSHRSYVAESICEMNKS